MVVVVVVTAVVARKKPVNGVRSGKGTYAVSDTDEVLDVDDFVGMVHGCCDRRRDSRRGYSVGVSGRGQLLLLVGLLGTRHCCCCLVVGVAKN